MRLEEVNKSMDEKNKQWKRKGLVVLGKINGKKCKRFSSGEEKLTRP